MLAILYVCMEIETYTYDIYIFRCLNKINKKKKKRIKIRLQNIHIIIQLDFISNVKKKHTNIILSRFQ